MSLEQNYMSTQRIVLILLIFWSSLKARKRVVDSDSYFKVGDGSLIDVAIDPWISTVPNFCFVGSN